VPKSALPAFASGLPTTALIGIVIVPLARPLAARLALEHGRHR